MKNRTAIILLIVVFTASLYVVHKISDQRGFERGAANKAAEVTRSYQQGVRASEDSIEPLVSHAYQEGIRQGKVEKELEVAGCTVAMAHKGRCYLPCESYFDCVAKNGHAEKGY
jgi:hypothetical protein